MVCYTWCVYMCVQAAAAGAANGVPEHGPHDAVLYQHNLCGTLE